MSNPDEEISKEKNVESNRDLDRGDIKSVSLYLIRSFGSALLCLGAIFSVMHFFKEYNSSTDLIAFGTESIKKSSEMIVFSVLGAMVGLFLAVIYYSGYDFWYFLGVVTLGMVLFGVGCRFWKRWWVSAFICCFIQSISATP